MSRNQSDNTAPTGAPAPGRGRTQRAREGRREPRLPHERDESADSQDSEAGAAGVPSAVDIGKRAYGDVTQGRQDTGRAPVTDEVYDQLKERPTGPADKRG